MQSNVIVEDQHQAAAIGDTVSAGTADQVKVAVVGAGPAGLSCALELLKAGYAVDIFELDEQVGGLSRTIEVLGQKADVGSHHFYSKSTEVNQFWHQYLAPEDYLVKQRETHILYNGKFFDYPLKGFDALYKLGFIESARCVLSYAYATLFPRKDPTFEAWVSNAFGRRLYEIFFKTYSERLWGIKCTELSDQFANQRIKTLNLRKTIVNALRPTHSGKAPKTEFIYPRLGSGMFYDSVAQEIKRLGGHFYFKQRVLGFTTELLPKDAAIPAHWASNAAAATQPRFSAKVTGIVTQELAEGQGDHRSNAPIAALAGAEPVTRPYDIVVSSGVISDLVNSLEALPDQVRKLSEQLRYRNTILVYLAVSPHNAKFWPDHWIYIHVPEVQMGRVSDFANWSTEMQQGHSEHLLAFEYWANESDPLWRKSDEELMALAQADAIKIGFAPAHAITGAAVHRVYKSYPVYFNGYEQVLSAITTELDKVANLYFIGRNGMYKYINMDNAVLIGLSCAHKIAGKYHDSLWSINSNTNYT